MGCPAGPGTDAERLRQRRIVARQQLDTARPGLEVETRIYGLDAAAGEQHPVQIVIDPRLLPPPPDTSTPSGPGATP